MKIGFNMLLWTTNLVEEEFHLLEKIKKVGYDGVEIPVFGGEEEVSHFLQIGKTLKDNGLDCTSVTVIPDEKRSPISENKDFRNKLYCLGDACIDKRHMEILKGDRNFKLKHRNRDKCINIRDLRIHGKPYHGNLVHDDNNDASTQFIPNALHIEDCNRDLTSMEFKLKPEPHYMDTGYGSVLEGIDIPIDPNSVPPAQPSNINPPIDPKKFSILNELSTYEEDTE